MLASYLCYLFINNINSTLLQVQGQAVTHASKSTRRSQKLDQHPCTNNALFLGIPQSVLNGHVSDVMIISLNLIFTKVFRTSSLWSKIDKTKPEFSCLTLAFADYLMF